MKIPHYWAKGKYSPSGDHAFIAWQWSDNSLEEAQQQANDRAREIARKFQLHQHLDRYSYGRNPLREEIVQSIKNQDGGEVGIITRNLYGALVLNAAQAMFIDIDFPKKSTQEQLAAGISKLFGNKPAPAPEQTSLQTIERWAQGHPEWTLRVYRTFGGLRCLITNEIFDPTHEDHLAILRNLQSDPLYITLCRQQESFRARLTPKPWRCNVNNPPLRYPWENAGEEARYRQWQDGYTRAASRFATCRLLKQIGDDRTHPSIQPILAIHDEMACGASNLNLA